MGLFKKSYRFVTYNDKVASQIQKITDQKRLMEIAIEAKDILIVEEALNHITDDYYLYEIYQSKYTSNINTKAKALDRIKDQEIFKKMIQELSPTHRDLRKIYDKIENPPFELSIQMNSKIAEDNLLKDLDRMKYPDDKDKLKEMLNKMITKESVTRVLELLPFEEEKEFYKDYLLHSNSLIARIEIINKFPIDQDLLKTLLMEGNTNLPVTITIGRKLDSNSPLLDKEVCPKCGALDSISLFDEYRRSIDMNVRGYSCKKCNYEFLEKNGLGELKYKKTTLRELIEK